MVRIERPFMDELDNDDQECFTDSQTWSATIATTGETTLGNIAVPAGELWIIYSIFCSGYGGEYRLDVTGTNAIADLVGKFLQNDVLKAGRDDELADIYTRPYEADIVVRGAATLTMYVTNAASTSTTCKGMIQYRRYKVAQS
jgi:hypothetical protein